MIGWYSGRTDIGTLEVIAQPLGRNSVTMGAYVVGKADSASAVRRSERFMRDRAVTKLIPLAHQTGRFAARGLAVVNISVSEEGIVDEAELVSGPESLRELAEQAATGWTFRPVHVGGESVRVNSSLTFNLR